MAVLQIRGELYCNKSVLLKPNKLLTAFWGENECPLWSLAQGILISSLGSGSQTGDPRRQHPLLHTTTINTTITATNEEQHKMAIVTVRATYTEETALGIFFTRLFGVGTSEVTWRRGRFQCQIPRVLTTAELAEFKRSVNCYHYEIVGA